MHLLLGVAVYGSDIVNLGMGYNCEGPLKILIRSEGAAVAVQLRGQVLNRRTA